MNRRKPHTRCAAAAPRATKHLTVEQQAALEAGGEAEHQIGWTREQLLRSATKIAGRARE